MGSTRWASLSIAGVAIVDNGGSSCRIDLVDAEGMSGTLVGQTTEALDFTVHMQLSDKSQRAVRFKAKIAQLPVSVLKAAVLAMESAMRDGNTFPVIASDTSGVDTISQQCLVDYDATGGKPFTRGAFAAGHVKDVVIGLIST